MSNDSNSSIARAARIIGLGLLSVAFLGYTGTKSDAQLLCYFGLAFALWCLIEIVRSYSQRSS